MANMIFKTQMIKQTSEFSYFSSNAKNERRGRVLKMLCSGK